jgi:hypothetical protein
VKFLRGCGLSEWEIESSKLYHAKTESDRTSIMYRVLELRRDAPLQFYSVFISHSSTDKPFARTLHDALQEHGVRCWLDEKQLLPGDDLADQIDRGIRLWDKMILCCSERSLRNSWWVETELDKALQKEQRIRKEEGRTVRALVPLDLDGYVFSGWESGRKSFLTTRVVGDGFKGWKEGEPLPPEAVEKLIRALRADDGGREPPPLSRL